MQQADLGPLAVQNPSAKFFPGKRKIQYWPFLLLMQPQIVSGACASGNSTGSGVFCGLPW